MAVLDGSTLTDAEIVTLVEGPVLHIDGRLDLLDADDVFIEDISESFVLDGSSVEHGVYRTVHRTATLVIGRELEWGSQRLRPWLLLSADGETWWRWPLGVFLPTVPERAVNDENEPVWTVACMDKLDVLNTPIGAAYSVSGGANIVAAVRALITAAGETKTNLDSSSKTAGSARVFSFGDGWTELTTVNDLLGKIGYRALWVDRDGWYRAETYRSPSDLPVVWDYSTDSPTTTVGQQRTSTADFYGAANQVVGVRDVVADDLPETDAGLVARTNEVDGPTSIAARGGRTIRREITGQYADHESLVTAVEAALEVEKRVAQLVTINVSHNPIHSHFDVVNLRDDAIGVNGRFLVTDWVLPFSTGQDMKLSLRAI